MLPKNWEFRPASEELAPSPPLAMLRSPLSLSLLALSAHSVSAAFVDYTLNIVNAQISPDGFIRSASLVNGQFPGTVLFANKGDVLRNTVVNQLTDPTMRRSTTIVSRITSARLGF